MSRRTFSLLAQVHVTIEADPSTEHEAGFATALDEHPEEIRAAMARGLDNLIRHDLTDPMVKDVSIKVTGTVIPCDDAPTG